MPSVFTPQSTDVAVFGLYALLWFVAFLGGIALGSAVSAIWLRLAVQWLRFEPISYLDAFRSTLIANFSAVMFHVAIGINQGYMLAVSSAARGGDPRLQRYELSRLPELYQPTFFLFSAIFSTVMIAAVFCRTIPSADEQPVTFPQALSLAAFYQALSLAIGMLFIVIAYLIAVGWTGWTGT